MATINKSSSKETRRGLAIALGMLLASVVVSANDTFKMQTHPKEVPGTWEIENGDYEQAVELLEIALQRARLSGKNKGPIHTNLCMAYTKLGDYDVALHHCDRAVEISPAVGVAYNNRGVLYALMQRFTSAGMDFEAAAGHAESHEVATLNKARLREQVAEYGDDPPKHVINEPAV
jgi:Flp pilus assembly protein TadD